MNLALTVLQITAPVFFLAGIGFGWVRLGYAYDTAFVTRLSMTLAVPALVFTALADSTLDVGLVGRMAVATICAYVAMSIAFFILCRVFGLELRTWLAPLVFGNTGNLGLPLCLLAFGETGLALGVVFFSTGALMQFTFGLWVVAGGGSPVKALREPMVAAALLGGLFLWRGWTLPEVAANALGLVGQMAIPLMLLTLGVAVARLQVAKLGLVAAMAGLKVGLAFAAGLVVASALALPDPARGVLILQLVTPVAVTSYLLAEKYGADGAAVAGLVVVSTLLSVVTLPAILAVLI